MMNNIGLYIAVFCLVLAVVHAVVLCIREYKQRKRAKREKDHKRAEWEKDHKGGIVNGGWHENINRGERVLPTEQLCSIIDALKDSDVNEEKVQTMLEDMQQLQEEMKKGRNTGQAE